MEAIPITPPSPFRVSDGERERTVGLLREHWLAGRLTLAELEERCGQAWRARYVEDLWQAYRELPAPPAPPALQGTAPVTGKAAAALTLGVTGLVMLLLSFGFLFMLSLPLSCIAWALGRGARRAVAPGQKAPSVAVAGEVLGVVGTTLASMVLAGCGIWLVSVNV